jgi:hypothetical protein
MFKKFLKITGVILLLLIVALFAIPYFFKDAIVEKIVATVNENLDATVKVEDADLSLFRNFPNANVEIEKLVILNKAPFEGDTLVSFGELGLDMSLREIFKDKSEPINIDAIESKDGLINIIFNKDGIGNFDIALENAEKKDDGKSDPLALKIKEYKVENFRFKYYDERSKMKLSVDSLYHSGNGDFTADKLDLVTKSAAKISLDLDKTNYMNRVPLTLDAVLGIDMKQNKYTFKDNKALINQLPLEFNGFIQILEEGQQYDVTFRTPSSDFKNFLSLIPSAYSGSLANIQTTGAFTVNGWAKGIYSEKTVPKFNLAIASAKASFKYPNLPKSVQNIVIDTKIVNETGILNDTYINLDKLAFTIEGDVFNAKANIRNVVENPLVDAQLKGTVNLGNLSQAYPIKLEKPLAGILKADVTSAFDMQSVEKSQYERIRNAGSVSVTGFRYVDDNGKALNISTAAVRFDPTRVNLQQFNATTGKSDLSVTGILDNFYGFVFKDQELKGNFNLTSNQLAVSDFMTEDKPEQKNVKTEEPMKIPAFLNCTLTARANTVLYDNLVLKNVSGKITIRDEKATLENVRTNIFGGLIAANGNVSTKGKIPTFDMDLQMNSVDIAQSFTALDMLKNIAPIANVINGKLTSTINVKGNLDAKEMTPDLGTISGDLKGQLRSTTVNANNSGLLTALDNNLNFIDLSKLNLNDIQAALTFSNGKVNLKPVDLKYRDIKLQFTGQHGFDQSMNYNVRFDVPAKYLGTEINNLLAKLAPSEANKIQSVPVNAVITGNFKKPQIRTDMKQAVTSLTTQLVNAQKDRLLNQGKNVLGDILGGTKKDTAKTKQGTAPKPSQGDQIKTKAADALKDLFGKKKKEQPKEPAK